MSVNGDPCDELLLRFYADEMRRVEFYETQRERVTGLFFTLASALVAVVAINKSFDMTAFIVGWILLGVGVFGAAFSAKNYFRSRRHYERARAFRKKFDSNYGGKFETLRLDADEEFKKDFESEVLFKLLGGAGDISAYWVIFPLLISLVGAIFIALSICRL